MASARFICGTQDFHCHLERRLASFPDKDDSLLFAACFDATTGLFEPLLGQRCSGAGHLIGTQSRRSRVGRFNLDPATRGIGVNAPGLHQHVTVTANIVSYFRSLFANSCRLDGHCRCLINHIPPAFLVLSSFHFLCQIETLKLQNSCCLAKCSPPSVDQHRRFFVET